MVFVSKKFFNMSLLKFFTIDINDSRVYPLWMIYEFEIVAFIAPQTSGEVLGKQYIASLEKVLKNHQHKPEAINDNNYFA